MKAAYFLTIGLALRILRFIKRSIIGFVLWCIYPFRPALNPFVAAGYVMTYVTIWSHTRVHAAVETILWYVTLRLLTVFDRFWNETSRRYTAMFSCVVLACFWNLFRAWFNWRRVSLGMAPIVKW